jgi:hypothetical protein
MVGERNVIPERAHADWVVERFYELHARIQRVFGAGGFGATRASVERRHLARIILSRTTSVGKIGPACGSLAVENGNVGRRS